MLRPTRAWINAGALVTVCILAAAIHVASVRAQPAPVFTSLATGYSHTCAISQAGQVYCWGSNDFGECGQPGNVTIVPRPTVVPLPGLAVELALGRIYSCARLADGRVACWGMGPRSVEQLHRPRIIEGIPPAEWLTAGMQHTCAMATDSQMYCWATTLENLFGPDRASDPGVVSGARGARMVATHTWTCLLDDEDRIRCLDFANAAGSANARFRRIGIGYFGLCGVDRRGDVRCTDTDREPPRLARSDFERFTRTGDVSDVAVGGRIVCALHRNGAVTCFRRADARPRPRFRIRRPRFTSVDAGYEHACGITRRGEIFCWGSDEHGQLGSASVSSAPATPVRVE